MPQIKLSRRSITAIEPVEKPTIFYDTELTGFGLKVQPSGASFIVLLALHPIRIKNFATLLIGETFLAVDGRWWLHIPAENTKSFRMDERQVPEFVTDLVNRYIESTGRSYAAASITLHCGSRRQLPASLRPRTWAR